MVILLEAIDAYSVEIPCSIDGDIHAEILVSLPAGTIGYAPETNDDGSSEVVILFSSVHPGLRISCPIDAVRAASNEEAVRLSQRLDRN